MKQMPIQDVYCQDSFPEIDIQISECKAIRDNIIEILKKYPELSEEQGHSLAPAKIISDSLYHIEESYDLVEKICDAKDIDRTHSMFSGPSYCSKKYPQVIDDNGELMYPVLQIDLLWINKECRKKFPEGLLQLWINSKWNRHIIRIVPWKDVELAIATPFEWGTLRAHSAKKKIKYDETWPCDPETRIINQLVPVGMSLPSISPALSYCEREVPDELMAQIDELEARIPSRGTHLFGDFYDPNHAPGDLIPYKLFLTMCDWGSQGYAHIFYVQQENGDIAFKFLHCPR